MMGAMDEVKDVPAESRFEIYVDGTRVGKLDYVVSGDTFSALHTEIDESYGGQGLGSRLVAAALDSVRDTGLKLRPVCPFVVSFVDRHPDYSDLLAPEQGS